jgi:hypothetical protein
MPRASCARQARGIRACGSVPRNRIEVRAERRLSILSESYRRPVDQDEANGAQHRLGRAGRDVDDQSLDLATRHRFEVHADRIEHAALDQRLSGFEDVPEIPDEVQQAAAEVGLARALHLADEGGVRPRAGDEGLLGGGVDKAQNVSSMFLRCALQRRAHQRSPGKRRPFHSGNAVIAATTMMTIIITQTIMTTFIAVADHHPQHSPPGLFGRRHVCEPDRATRTRFEDRCLSRVETSRWILQAIALDADQAHALTLR